ncbi:hemogen isoform X2 [Amia ocellicauda]|uniref:hemogen isoform X2 n=1 Tax=Amia ocellicauda TaxID=2972642 RepID=UPI003463D046
MENPGKDYQQSEYNDPENNEDGIRRRLRDRDLLRKRRAEAQEKETYQEKSRRKRERREKSGSGRKGRPKKGLHEEPEPAQEEPPQEGQPGVEEDVTPLPPSQDPLQELEELLPGPSSVEVTFEGPNGSQSVEAFVIEDLGPDEKQDLPQAVENLSAAPEGSQELSQDYPTLEQEYFSAGYI